MVGGVNLLECNIMGSTTRDRFLTQNEAWTRLMLLHFSRDERKTSFDRRPRTHDIWLRMNVSVNYLCGAKQYMHHGICGAVENAIPVEGYFGDSEWATENAPAWGRI